jgi:hypothetical protein
MQTVEITRTTVAGGRRVQVGDTPELTDADAAQLIAMGKAVPVSEAPVARNREKEVEAKISKRGAEAAAADKAKKAKD